MERVVVVTGSSRGIGRATALRLASRGFRVFGTVRSADDAARLENESDGSVRAVRLDLGDDASIQDATHRLVSLGVEGLNGLVNVAAADGRSIPLECVTRADLDVHFGVTVIGTAVLTASMIPLLRSRRGRIVNVGAGALPMPLLGCSFAAKQALETMSDVLRVELARQGIRVSVVEPGMTRWEDTDAQLAAYADALDRGVAAVGDSERDRYRRAADRLQGLNQRLLNRGARAENVAATIERALTARRSRPRYYCGAEQKLAAWLKRAAPTAITDRVLRTLVRL
jgi:NAD(P)-dependent dehydrogenase (short-subunit alcohol dehydrogenase family)